MKQSDINEVVSVALSAYATHKDYTLEEWLKCQEAKRKHPDVKKRYDHLMSRP